MFTIALLLQLATPTILDRPLPVRRRITRDTTINYVILHNDGGTGGYSVARRTLIRRRLSYHYYISRNGNVIKMLDPKYEASHVGYSYWNGLFRINRYSIGICLENGISLAYSIEQYNSLAWLILNLQQRFPDSTTKTIVGHSEVALPLGRKTDPGPLFDYNHLNRILTDESNYRSLSKK